MPLKECERFAKVRCCWREYSMETKLMCRKPNGLTTLMRAKQIVG